MRSRPVVRTNGSRRAGWLARFAVCSGVGFAASIAATPFATAAGDDPPVRVQRELRVVDPYVILAQAPAPAPPGATPPVPDTTPIPMPNPIPTPPAPIGISPGAAPPTPAAPPVAPAAPPVAPAAAAALAPETGTPASAAFAASIAGAVGTSGSLTDLSGIGASGLPSMIGDLGPSIVLRQVPGTAAPPVIPPPFPPPMPPKPPSPRLATSLAPSVRGFKIAENQSPRPVDRVYFTFNYFTELNSEINRRFESPVNGLRAYRYIFGFEKTIGDRMSFGMRLPLNQLTANSTLSGNFAKQGGTSTSLGDLSVFAKFVFAEDKKTGSLVSAGMEVTPPTGPNTFASARYIQSLHSTTVQPFVGYILARNRAYLHGFTSLQVPMNPADATFLYNDIGVGYFVYRNPDPNGFLRLIAPTFEVHVSTPLNHRNPFNTFDPAASANVVNFTYGLNVGVGRRSMITLGFINPVTTPKPFDFETTLLFNMYFGGPRRVTPALPPVIGG